MTRELLPLVDHLWQSTLVAVLAWLVCGTVLKAGSARLRFGVWFAASIKCLVPFAILVSAGHRLTGGAPLKPSQSQRIFDMVMTTGARVVTPAQLALPAAPQAPSGLQQWLVALLVIAWAVGAGIVLWRWLVQWREIHALARGAQPAGHFRGLPLLTSARMRDRGIEPGVVGLWRHAIVLPAGIDALLTPLQYAAVLEHEWQHAQRRDNLLALMHTVVQLLLWFHPAVWFIGRRLTEEREKACDEAVLQSSRAEDYAEGILRVCRFCRSPLHRHASGITSADLRARMEAILKNEPPRQLGIVRRFMLGASLATILTAPLVVGWLTAQAVSAQDNSFVGLATSADRKFEIASIKPNNSGNSEFRLGPPLQGSMTIVNLPLAGIIAQSFRTNRSMMFGAPEWTETTRYDLVGKGPDPTVGAPEVWEMMRSLLIERFHLKYRIEAREMAVFALTVARGGHKLTLGENGRCAQAIKAGERCGDIAQPPVGAAMHNMPIGALITAIGRRAGGPIVDRTGLTGRYDVSITWLPEGVTLEQLDLKNVPPENRPPDMSLFDALEKQAGLKLVPDRAPMPVLIVESVSRPDPN